MMMAAAILFITATADTLPLTQYARTAPAPRYEVVCAAAPWPAAPQVVTFQRDSGKPEPWDSWVMTANAINLCARTDGAAWRVCSVYADGRLVGTFIRPADERLGHGQDVEQK